MVKLKKSRLQAVNGAAIAAVLDEDTDAGQQPSQPLPSMTQSPLACRHQLDFEGHVRQNFMAALCSLKCCSTIEIIFFARQFDSNPLCFDLGLIVDFSQRKVQGISAA